MGGRGSGLRAVFAADVISTTGTEMTAVALPWFVLVTTGSPARMAGVMAAEFAGTAMLGIPSGRLAHRLGPRRTMLAADAFRAALVGLVPLLYWTGGLRYALLVAIGFLVGACFPAYSSSQRLVLAGVTGDDEAALTRVGGALGAFNELASFAGPALGGVLVAIVGAPTVLVIDAATYAVAFAIVAAAVPGVVAVAVDEQPPALLAGLRWLWSEPRLRRQILAAMPGELGWTAMMAALPVTARRRYTGGAALAGAFVGAYGAGSVVGGVVTARSGRVGWRAAIGSLVAVAVLAWVLVPREPVAVVVLAVAGTGLCNQIFFPRLFAALTVAPPPELRVQVMTAAQTVLSLTGPLGFVGAGLLLDRGAIGGAFLLVAVAATLAAAVSVPWRRGRGARRR